LTTISPGFETYKIIGNTDPTRLSLIDAQHNVFPADKYPGYEMHLPLPDRSQASTFRVFAGPFDTEILKKVDAAYSNSSTGYNPDYVSCQSFHGWFSFISEPFAQFLFILMKFFHKITFSWGISIILLTIVLRLMLYPLNAWSIKSTARMQQIAPQVTAIQEKYKKDPKRVQAETMALYREKGVNPLTGCLPLLIQMPFLIGMFDLLKSSFELRGVSFIPGWIDNLTAPDVLFSWDYPLPFFGNQFHLLPILLGVVMYIQQKFASSAPKNQKILTDQQKQQKFMGNIMVIVFTVMFYHFPSGLNIYWLSSMLLGILQQWYMTKKIAKTSMVEVK
jgi:YidC/Oxa1 family membrane protein insertase